LQPAPVLAQHHHPLTQENLGEVRLRDDRSREHGRDRCGDERMGERPVETGEADDGVPNSPPGLELGDTSGERLRGRGSGGRAEDDPAGLFVLHVDLEDGRPGIGRELGPHLFDDPVQGLDQCHPPASMCSSMSITRPICDSVL
jgi:hypothetical protein